MEKEVIPILMITKGEGAAEDIVRRLQRIGAFPQNIRLYSKKPTGIVEVRRLEPKEIWGFGAVRGKSGKIIIKSKRMKLSQPTFARDIKRGAPLLALDISPATLESSLAKALGSDVHSVTPLDIGTLLSDLSIDNSITVAPISGTVTGVVIVHPSLSELPGDPGTSPQPEYED